MGEKGVGFNHEVQQRHPHEDTAAEHGGECHEID
eukprot:CAMPEP_0116971124 /NCGR_PEP_ID=MMETSP0467-20121206/52975_1 /TAXON_ID=283647 /ORGANISM="Mesodinium pulex, Strain SPMC105" /LENGTH=33 /DNA_ID= /DNA_START= /DNA_END= /DNA_ORIENTATION=